MKELILKLFFVTLLIGFILSSPEVPIEYQVGGLFLAVAIILLIIMIFID